MQKTIIKLKKLDYNLWLVLMLTGLLPVIYSTVRIYFLGSLPSEWGYNIASQLGWVDIFYEVLQEALILPLFYLFGKALKDNSEFLNRVITGSAAVTILYGLFSFIIILFSPVLVRAMAQDPLLLDRTIVYIRLEAGAKIPGIISKFLFSALIVKGMKKSLLCLLLLQMSISILLDSFLVRQAEASFSLGVNGIAVSNFITNTLLVLFSAWVLLKNLNVENRKRLSFLWLHEWFQVGKLSGLESLVRNTAFILMILRIVNLVRESGTFWLMNSFIWGWVLLPILSLGEVVRRDVAKKNNYTSVDPKPYLVLTIGISLLWIITIPLWGSFLENVLGISDYHTVLKITLVSIPFYIIFALNNVIDNIFYGAGRTDLMLIQSIAVNTLYYGTLFVLFKLNLFIPTIVSIAVVFGFGMAIDSAITFWLYWKVFRKQLGTGKMFFVKNKIEGYHHV